MSQMLVLAIRPEPGLGKTIEAGTAIGLAITGFPLFEVAPVPWEPPAPDTFDALLVGSANVFRHGGARLVAFRSVPVLAVGEATAMAARESGFEVAAVGKGGLQSLIDAHGPKPAHWLRLAGEEHVLLTIPDNIQLTTCITYRVNPVDITEEMALALKDGCLVLLHSAAAARHFEEQCLALDIDRSRIALAALGPRITEDLSEGWKQVETAETPSEDTLLALAKRMCETI